MNQREQELIDLVQSQLPSDLTEEQLQELRDVMRTSEPLREAILDELRIEQGLATRLAPEGMQPDQWVDHISRLASARRRTRFIWLNTIILLSALLIGGGIALVSSIRIDEPDPRTVAANDQSDEDQPVKAARTDDQPDEAQDPDAPDKARLNGGGDAAMPDRPDQPADADDVAIVEPNIDEADFAPAWRLFDDPAANDDRRWLGRINHVLKPTDGDIQIDENQGYARVRGKMNLTPPTAAGRTIRLRPDDIRNMQLTLWSGSRGVMIELDRERLFRAYEVERQPPKSKPASEFPEGIDSRFLREHRVTRLDERIDFNWDNDKHRPDGMPKENLAVRWTGKVLTPRKGKYHFIATSDDGVRLYINGRRLIDDWRDRGPEESRGEIELDKGSHDIVVEYFQGGGGSAMKLEWEGPDIKRELIPADAMRSSDGAKKGLTGRYVWGGSSNEPKEPPFKRQVLVAQDDWSWRRLREGAVDLRYQDGQVVLARGDVVLVRAPMPEPKEATFDGEMRLWYAEVMKLHPLPEPEPTVAKPDTSTAAAKLAWKLDHEDRDKHYDIKKEGDGTLRVVRHAKIKEGDNERDNELDLRVEHEVELSPGVEITLHVAEASPHTAVTFGHPQSDHRWQLAVGEYEGARVLCEDPFNHGHKQSRFEQGHIVGDTFAVRATYGVDHLLISYSNDGKRWLRYQRHDFDVNNPLKTSAVRVGAYCYYKPGERRIALRQLDVRRRPMLLQLADANLVKQVVDEIPEDKRHEAYRWANQIKAMREKRPKDATPRAWEAACDAWIIASMAPPKYKIESAVNLVRNGADGATPQQMMTVLGDLPHVMTFHNEDHRPNAWRELVRLYDGASEKLWLTGQRDALSGLLDQWYHADFAWSARWTDMRYPAPLTLTRLRQYDLLASGEWEPLRISAMRFDFMSRRGNGRHERQDPHYPVVMLSSWMETQAARRLGDEPRLVGDAERSRQWSLHPLIVDADRESLNIVSEFLASVDAEAYDHACRIMTQKSLPDGIAPVDQSEQLFKATYVMLRHLLDTNQQLATMLKTKYQGIGLVRLRQALANGQIDQLEAIATQFHGTPSAREALGYLSDRDLSMGNFFSAASRYEALMAAADEEQRRTLAAKRRLALAMAGVEAGEPVKHHVPLQGQKLSGNDFEKLVQSLLKERRKSTGMMGVGQADQPVAPGPTDMSLKRLETLHTPPGLPGHHRGAVGTGAGGMTWTFHDRYLLLHQHGRAWCFDLKDKRVVWRKDGNADQLDDEKLLPGRPLVFGDKVYLPLHRDRHSEMACLNLKDGNDVWRQRFDDEIAGDPVIIGPWLYVLTVRQRLGDYADLMLRRVSPDTGESVLAKKLVRMRYSEAMFLVGRPVLVDDALLFRAGNALICSDLLGETRWIRRLAFVPPEVDPQLFDEQSLSELVVHEGKVIVAAPGSPNLTCVDIVTGAEVWSAVQPQLRRVVGLVDGRLILAEDRAVQAIDPATGKPLWHRPTTAHHDAILPAKDNTIALLTLDQVHDHQRDDPSKHRHIVWRKASDGSFVRETYIEDHRKDYHDARLTTTDGRSIISVTNYSNHKEAQLVVIEPK